MLRNTDSTGQPFISGARYLAEVDGADVEVKIIELPQGWVFRLAQGADDGACRPVAELQFPFPKC